MGIRVKTIALRGMQRPVVSSSKLLLCRLDRRRASLRLGALALACLAPIGARADNWSGIPTLILGVLLVPATVVAILLVVLAFVPKPKAAHYGASTALFVPAAWYGFRFFAGATELVSEGPGLVYFAAMGVLAICVCAYLAMSLKYWRGRLVDKGPRSE